MRLTTQRKGEHHMTIPRDNPLKLGTLNAIMRDVSEYLGIPREDLSELLAKK